jgi:selenocysteine lyase/cysteine desulfurase
MSNENKAGLARRDLIKLVGGASVATGLLGAREAHAFEGRDHGWHRGVELPDELMPHPTIWARRGTEGFWHQVRRAFALPRNYIHMNTGTTGSQPAFSLNNLAVYNLYKSRDPRDWQANLAADFPDLFPLVNNSALTARQNALATMYGASPGEIIISYNTTDACNLILAGTPWKAGDRIVTTTFEHPALAGPLAWVRDHMGVEVVVINMPSNWTASVSEVLSWFEAELKKPLPTGAKQYVATCEIFYKNGIRLPVKQICALARSLGAYSIIDNAHGWGMIPVNCHDYGADYICGAGHKWLCGGPGTGIFYVRNSGANLPPWNGGNWAGYGNLFTIPSARFGRRDNWTPSGINGRGETNTPALYAMSDAASFFDHVGLADIYQRGVKLAQRLQQKVMGRWGLGSLAVQVLNEPEYQTFLTAFNPFKAKDDPAQFATMNTAFNTVLANLAAGNPKIYIRSITWRSSKAATADDRIAFRVSTHAMYNDWAQIDHLFQRIVEEVDKTGLPQL